MEHVPVKGVKLSKEQLRAYFILVVRILLAYILIDYGWAKLSGNQFGVADATMNQLLKEVDLFRLSWYLADHQPFKSFVGITQIVTAALLVYNRTAIIGAFMAIPILLNILMWDVTFMGLYTPFTLRLSFYLLLDFFIIWHHRDRVLPAVRMVMQAPTAKPGWPLWAYLLLPVFCIGLELVGAIPSAIIHLFSHINK